MRLRWLTEILSLQLATAPTAVRICLIVCGSQAELEDFFTAELPKIVVREIAIRTSQAQSRHEMQ